MPTLRERVETTLPPTETFAYVGDFANAATWDPGVVESRRLDGGPIEVGSRYHLMVRMGARTAPMTYTVTEFEPDRRVVLHGSGSGVEADDAIDVGVIDGRTVVEYTATIRLVGVRRIAEPLLAGTFRRIARDARDGLAAALDRRAGSVVASAAPAANASAIEAA